MYRIEYTNRFKKDLKRCEKRGLKLIKLLNVIELLATLGELPNTYRPHKLSGNKSGLWECHVQSDWLLVWEQDDELLTLLFLQTGTHSDIFK